MLSSASIRYLLAIYQLGEGGHAVRSVDIAARLGVSRASVVKMLRNLTDAGLVSKEYYGNVQFTPQGIREANRLYTQYTLLHTFFQQCLEVEEPYADSDAVSCLCCLSAASAEKLTAFALRRAGNRGFA